MKQSIWHFLKQNMIPHKIMIMVITTTIIQYCYDNSNYFITFITNCRNVLMQADIVPLTLYIYEPSLFNPAFDLKKYNVQTSLNGNFCMIFRMVRMAYCYVMYEIFLNTIKLLTCFSVLHINLLLTRHKYCFNLLLCENLFGYIRSFLIALSKLGI